MEASNSSQKVQQLDKIAEFRWEGKSMEIWYDNWIATPQGFFYWKDLAKNVLTLINSLFNVETLEAIETELMNQSSSVH
jgi:hypothetical protein